MVARASSWDIIEPYDLLITRGLQKNSHEFINLDEQIELSAILDRLETGRLIAQTAGAMDTRRSSTG